MKYKRIARYDARKLYNCGCDILLLPCRVSLVALYHGGNQWVTPVTININTCNYDKNEFYRTVANYEYYNCNAELGYYAHYYVSAEELEKYNIRELRCN